MPSFRLPGLPSAQTESPVEIADFWEIVVMRTEGRRAALSTLRAAVARSAEVDPALDAEEDIEEEARFDDAIEEIRYRRAACGAEFYPFDWDPELDRVIMLKSHAIEGRSVLYLFLLLATRLNMNTRRCFDGIDGPLLFEEVCEEVLHELCGTRGETHRFGTSAGDQNFNQRLQAFFQALQEFPLRADREIPKHGGDDGVDLAWWNTFTWDSAVPYLDNCAKPRGKLILLAQCKTGTSWDTADLTRLQPDSFFVKWMGPPPQAQVGRAFMAAMRIDRHNWEDTHRDGGLVFDRCRIVDYAAARLSESVLERVRRWTEAALACPDVGGV